MLELYLKSSNILPYNPATSLLRYNVLKSLHLLVAARINVDTKENIQSQYYFFQLSFFFFFSKGSVISLDSILEDIVRHPVTFPSALARLILMNIRHNSQHRSFIPVCVVCRPSKGQMAQMSAVQIPWTVRCYR